MKSIRTPSLPISLFLSVALLLLAGCSDAGPGADAAQAGQASAELPVVKVAINTWPGLGPFFVAREKGFDREEGVRLEVTITENTEARRSSLLSGEVDLVGITLDTVILARARGLPMVVVGQSDFSDGGDGILAKKDIKTIADLKGKRIACAEGLPSHYLLLHVLSENGLSPKDIELVPAADGGQAAFLFISGSVDAAVTWDPWITNAESLTEGHVLISTKELPRLLLGIVAANEDRLPQRADRITRAMRAWFKGVQFVIDNPDEAFAIMSKEFNVPADEFALMAKGAAIADLQENLSTFGTASQPGPIMDLADAAAKLWINSGVIEEVDPATAIDWSIIELLSE